MKKILALDLATKTGWANNTASGVEDFKKRAGDSRGMIYIRFDAWAREMITLCTPEIVVYERPHSRGRAANELLNGLLAHLQRICEELSVEYTDCPSTTLKKFATGKGNAGKDDMMSAYLARFGTQPIDDNESDARWLYTWGVDQFCGSEQ